MILQIKLLSQIKMLLQVMLVSQIKLVSHIEMVSQIKLVSRITMVSQIAGSTNSSLASDFYSIKLTSGMTVESCLSVCFKNSFLFAGLTQKYFY